MKQENSGDRRIRKTRKALKLALEKALAEKQLEQITIRDIADGADIAYTTFFRHYDSKESLLGDLADSEIDDLLDLTLPIFATKKSYLSTLALCRHVRDNERIWTALLTGGASANIRATFTKKVEEHAGQWPAESDWLPPEVGTPILCGIAMEVLAWWLGRAPEEKPEKVAKILDKFFSLVSR